MSQQKAIIDKLLTNVSSMYIPEGFISESLFPTVPSVQKTGKLAKYGNDHLRVVQDIIGGAGEYPRISTQVRSSTSYSIEGHGLEGLVTEDDYDNVEKPYDAEADETLGLTSTIMVGKEKSLADTLADTGIVTQNTTLSGQSQWSDYANSDPIDDFITGRQAVKDGCGAPPDLAWMSWDVAEQLRYHPQILDALGFKQNRPGGLNDQELASVLKVKRVMIGLASYESANKGQTSSLASIWGKHLWFAKMPEKAMKRQTSFGYCFKMAGRKPRRVFKWNKNNPPNSKAILVDDHYDFVITNVNAGYLVKNAIA
jgi:hypothetical protein